MSETYPVFLRLAGKPVLVVGAGAVAVGKLAALRAAGAAITVVAPAVRDEIRALGEAGVLSVRTRAVEAADLEDAWFVIAAAPPAVNRQVQGWAQARRCFVLAVDDLEATDAYAPAVLARGGVRVALSSEGRAPALVGLLRELVERALPEDAELARWVELAAEARAAWKAEGVPLAERRARLLAQLCQERGACAAKPMIHEEGPTQGRQPGRPA